MAKYRTDQIRNVALLGHSGSGKTSFTEVLLFKSDAISRQGRVEDGTTTSDWDEEEQRRGISINLSVVPVDHDDYRINFMDTPGYLDFVSEVVSGLHASEAGLILVDAVAGAEVGTELAWDRISAIDKPRMFLVNKMDRENASFSKAVESLQNTLDGSTILPLHLPIGEAESFQGIVSLVTMKAYMGADSQEADIPADMQDQVDEARVAMIEAAAESDDDLIMKYLEGEELTEDEIRSGLHQGLLSGAIAPVFCGSVSTGVGIERCLGALERYVPNPSERSIEAKDGEDVIALDNDESGPTAGQVFKTIIDRYVGRMNYVRCFSGAIKKDDRLVDPRTGETERIANLFHVTGKELEPTDELVAGDIGVVTKLEGVITGDTLSDAESNIVIPLPDYPQPLYAVAVSPATKADSAKMGQSLAALCEEDPTLSVEYISATKQNVVDGMGESHVDVAIRRLDSKYGVKVETSIPKVPYQETVSKSASAQYRHKKQTGGAGQFAEVHMRVEPQETGEGFQYVSEIFGGSISQVFLPSIEKGVNQVLDLGVIAGYPVVDVKAIVFDGKEHPVDSKDIAFQSAGREVFKLAMQQANPVLLEPIYQLEVTVPEEYMGDIMSDFNTRRGRVQGMEQKGTRTVIRALVPLAEILRYGTDLRSMTQGRGIYTQTFDHYDPVPKMIAQDVIAESQREKEEG